MASVAAGASQRVLPAARARRGSGRRARWFPLILWLSLAIAIAFLVLPVLSIFIKSSPARLLASLSSSESVDALRLSLETSAIALMAIVIVGTPAAYLLATRRFRGHALVLTLLELPLVLPPAVAGIALLASLGPHGLLGGVLARLHIALVFQTAGVVVALAFVAAPFYLRQAHAAFAAIERSHIEAALALGATQVGLLLRIAIPIARSALLAGLSLAWARALGEFGATLMFAGSFQRITQTAPLAIYDQFATDLPAALALSAVLVIVSGALLMTIKLCGRTQPPM
jgi:molybdate transport system permease protein